MATLYSNFQQGTLSATVAAGDVSLSSTAFASLPTVASPDELWLVLDPAGVSANPEVVRVTLHNPSATTLTVERGAQGSTARSWASGTAWSLATTSTDMGGVTPVGSITAFAASTAPTGWLLCDGQAVSRTTYAHLFAVIGTTYGTGNGSTTFNVPNLKGRIPVGLDSAQTEFDVLGETGGAKTHTLTSAESGVPAHSHANTLTNATVTPSHSHEFSIGAVARIAHSSTGSGARIAMDAVGTLAWTSDRALNITATTGTTGSETVGAALDGGTAGPSTTTTVGITNVNNTAANAASAHNNLQPYIALNYIIRAA